MTLYLSNISFIAVPKNATIAIESAFSQYAIDYKPHQHHTIDQVKAKSNNPCIATIRQPLQWMESYYKYLKYSPFFARNDSIWGLHSKTFAQFISAYINGQYLWPEPKRTQMEYVNNETNKAEYLYKYDNLNLAINKMSDLCNVTVSLDRYNVGRNIELDLPKSLITKFEQYAEKDYNLYETAM